MKTSTTKAEAMGYSFRRCLRVKKKPSGEGPASPNREKVEWWNFQPRSILIGGGPSVLRVETEMWLKGTGNLPEYITVSRIWVLP